VAACSKRAAIFSTVIVPIPMILSGSRKPRLRLKAFAAQDAILYEEKQNVLSAWLAGIPGGH
jgi:hypothetical protein